MENIHGMSRCNHVFSMRLPLDGAKCETVSIPDGTGKLAPRDVGQHGDGPLGETAGASTGPIGLGRWRMPPGKEESGHQAVSTCRAVRLAAANGGVTRCVT